MSKSKCQIKNSGFSLAELVVTMGVFLILAVIIVPIYGSFSSSVRIDFIQSDIMSTLKLAREKSVARENDDSYGVFFDQEEKKYILYKGASYEARNTAYDNEYQVPEVLDYSVNLSSADVNFSKGLGIPSATGTITFIDDESSKEKNITINDLGLIKE